MRNRYKMNRIASSDNYQLSKKMHSQYIRDWHNNNIEVVKEVSTTILVKETKYVRIFGKLIPISEEDLILHETLITV